MATQNCAPSYRRHIVSHLTHDDPDAAEMLIELMIMADSQTPTGAANHSEVISQAYDLTDDYRQHRDDFTKRVRERLSATQITTSQ